MSDYTHDTAPTQFAEAGGIRFAYRRFGNPDTGNAPVVFFQHFIGNLDDHDPAISDGLATDREVILFNNTGIASTSGVVPDTIEQMATDAATFIDALGLNTADLLGHSMGGLVAQQVAIQRPEPGPPTRPSRYRPPRRRRHRRDAAGDRRAVHRQAPPAGRHVAPDPVRPYRDQPETRS